MIFEKIINEIEDINFEFYNKAKEREDNLIKPPRSLGNLEEFAIRICGITSNNTPVMKNKRLLVFCSDNGVYEENVSSCPQSITVDQTVNLTRYITGASSMAHSFDDDIEVYDVGVNCDIDEYINNYNIKYNANIKNKVINKKITFGTNNLLKTSAMTYDNMIKAIDIGIESVKKAKDDGIDLLGVGEMGICNTTTSTCILCLLSGEDPKKITGVGAGLTDKGYIHKIEVIDNALKRVFDEETKELIKNKNSDYALKILQEYGGYDICSMVGAYIGASYYKIPIVIDGFIGIVAALVAFTLNNKIRQYMFTSHQSKEIGYSIAAKILNIKPMFNLEMRLGEGSGCIIAFRILDCALAMHNNMKTFDDANINDDYLDGIR